MNAKLINRNISFFNIFFFSLGGYYTSLILVSNFLSNNYSRIVTMPIRVVIILSIIYLVVNSDIHKKLKLEAVFFIIFSFFYIFKIAISAVLDSNLYIPPSQFLLYFLSFVFLPFLLVSIIRINKFEYEKIFNIIIFGCVSVSILTYLFYGKLLGNVSRISQEVGKDANYISPLALSYVSVLGISLCFSYLLTRTPPVKYKIYLYLTILLCLIPFFLGASRGSVLAFVFSISFYFLASRGLTKKIKLIFPVFIIIFLFFFMSNYMGTSVFDRVINISSAIDSQSSSAVRLYLWENGILQFLNNPLLGDSLQLEVAKHYPHNIIVEVLMSTGLIGFIPFFIFSILIFKKSIKIIRIHPEMFWVTNIFFMGFVMNMFSGAIWGASWFAIGAALISGFDLRVKNSE